MKRKFTFFFFLIISICTFSQTFNFENKYQYARSLSGKDPDSSEIVLSQIIENAQKENRPHYLAKAYYLKSYNSYLKSDAKGTLDYAEKTLEISEQNNYPIGKALAYRMRGTQYARLELLNESEQALNNAISEVKTDNTDEGHELKGMIYNSFLILFDVHEHRKKEEYSKKIIQEFQKINNITRRNELLCSAYTNMGYILSEGKKFNDSEYYLKKALGLVRNDDFYVQCNILWSIGFSFSEQDKSDSAISYYQKALKIAYRHNFKVKKIAISESLENEYAKLKDLNNFQKYKLENLELKDSVEYNNRMAVNKAISTKEKNFDKKLNKTKVKSNVLIIVSSILLLLLIFVFFIYFRLKEKHRKITNKIYNEGINPSSYQEDPQEIENSDSTSELMKISPAVEENILVGLENFEAALHFNNKNISRYKLANELNVNTKYLSAVIKKHKNFNFNQYINYLRINFIVNMLKTEPEYRKYKINHLSEITGYSSHSAFSLEFKKVVGLHPSAFIKNLDKIL